MVCAPRPDRRYAAVPRAHDVPVAVRPLVYDRKHAVELWDFRYRLEIYVPKDKREYGYYVLPILHGDRLVGRIEPVFDRKENVLRVAGVWWEDEPVDVEQPLRDLARWLGATYPA